MTATDEASARLVPVRDQIIRLLRRPGLKALIGTHLVVAAIILVRGQGWLQPFELAIYDQLRVAWAGNEPSADILLVGGTEEDIRRWHWPLRDADLAILLERIAGWQPRVIGVDLYRDRPEPPGSEQLAAVVAQHKEIVWAFKLREETRPGIPPPEELRETDRIAFTDVPTDAGNVVRRALLYADDGTGNYPGMGMAVALGYLAGEGIEPAPAPADQLRLGKALITPLDDTRGPYTSLDSRGYQILLDYRGGPHPFTLKSIGEITDGQDAGSLVRGRAVIIGITSESVKDGFATPFNTGFNNEDPIYGITVHAHVAAQLIRAAVDGTPSSLPDFPRAVEDLWIWAWALAGMALGLLVRHTVPAMIGSAAGLVILAGTAYQAFGAAVLLPVFPAAIAWVGSVGLTNRVMHAASNRRRTLLQKGFERFLPAAVIAQMLASETLPKLGGERREISVLFCDIAGSTTLAESIEPESLAAIYSDYFEGVCAAISEQGGTVTEFLGDGVVAFFGAPHQHPDHADRVVSAALAIDQFASRFSAEQKSRGVEFGHTRIGIHTGTAMVGNIGARGRLKYGAQGDVLNTGGRLDTLNKTIGTRICASGDTVRKAPRHRFRPIGAFVVKGRHGETAVFEPLCPQSYDADWIDRYCAAFGALEAGRPEAAELFETLHREKPHDACVAFHHRRLAAGETGALIIMTEK
jgi:adenylate cyclase